MSFTGHENHRISFADAAKLTESYRTQMNTGDRLGGYFSKDEIASLLGQDDCVGIRYYYGLDENNREVLVIVGVDADENDLVGSGKLCMEMSIMCPDQCSTSNILNS